MFKPPQIQGVMCPSLSSCEDIGQHPLLQKGPSLMGPLGPGKDIYTLRDNAHGKPASSQRHFGVTKSTMRTCKKPERSNGKVCVHVYRKEFNYRATSSGSLTQEITGSRGSSMGCIHLLGVSPCAVELVQCNFRTPDSVKGSPV